MRMSVDRKRALDGLRGQLALGGRGPGSRRLALNAELVLMAQHLAEVGPNINEIARRTGQFKETVRYRYHRFFLERGISLQAMMSYPKLGFKRLVLIVKLAPACEPNAKSIFDVMNDLCYLRSFTRVMLSGEYVLHVAVPSELAGECAAVYAALQRAGLFTELEILEFEEMRNPPMKPDSFDFVRGEWSFDWNSVGMKDVKTSPGGISKVERYDKIDLLILKELDIDASRKLVKMAKNLNVSENVLEFHYREHVQARGLIKGYRLVWQDTRGGPRQDRSTSSSGAYIEVTVLLTGGTQEEMAELMTLLNGTPFIWSEARGSAYCAEIFLPNGAYPKFLEYLDRFANRAGRKLRVLVMDQNQAARFVISHPLFDTESRKWQLNSGTVLKMLGLGLSPPAHGKA